MESKGKGGAAYMLPNACAKANRCIQGDSWPDPMWLLCLTAYQQKDQAGEKWCSDCSSWPSWLK